MIIGIDISSIPYGTGVSNYTLNLIEHLLSTDHQNSFKLFYSSLRLKLPKEIIKLINQHQNSQLYSFRLPPTLLSFLWNKLHLIPIELFIGDCDVFHTSDWTQPPTTHAKTICTIHDLTPFLYPQWLPKKIISNHTDKMFWAIKESIHFICVSQNSQKDLLRLFPKINKNNTSVVYEAAEDKYTEFYKYKADHKIQLINSIKNKYHLKNYILAQGTQEPRKNLTRLIEAFIAYKKLHPKSLLQLAISGKYGWGKIQTAPNPDIKVLGYVNETDLVQLHAAATALIYPSLYEGFGLPLLKAMAVGTPVVTSKNSSLQEISGNASLLVNPKSVHDITESIDKITKTMYRNRLIKKGLIRAKEFSWNTTATQTLKIYESVL